MKKAKSKNRRIMDAVEEINKALLMEEPDVKIHLHYGVDPYSPAGKKFIKSAKDFMKAYKEYFGIEKPTLEFVL